MKPCKIWEKSTDQFGYGTKRVGTVAGGDRRVERVHRLTYMEAHGLESIPTGLCVLHLCDVPACYEQSHLVLGTKQQNAQERGERNRLPQRGEKNHHARLTAVDVQAIRVLGAEGHRQHEIGARFGVSQTHVSAILRGARWV